MTTTSSSDPLADKLMQLRLYGCLARIDEIRGEAWLERVMAIEREERTRRNRADVVVIDGESYRLHEAEERQRVRATARKKGKERAAR